MLFLKVPLVSKIYHHWLRDLCSFILVVDKFEGKCVGKERIPFTDMAKGTEVGNGMNTMTDLETCLDLCAQTQGAIACEYAQNVLPLKVNGVSKGLYGVSNRATVWCTAFTTKAEGGRVTDEENNENNAFEEHCWNFAHFKA